MRRLFISVILAIAPIIASAQSFDYFVLSLSWSPTWCHQEGYDRQSEQCDPDADYGWSLHGLWPQYHQGYPSYCQTAKRPPSRAMTSAMVDIMGSSGLAWHQWKKHGVCSDLDGQSYLDLSRQAYDNVTRPSVFRKLSKPVRVPAKIIEEAFLKSNPALEPDMITVTCKQNMIQEVRICLSKSLQPVPCGRDVVRDCTLDDALLPPIP